MSPAEPSPTLSPGTRLGWDRVAGAPVLLYPEGVLRLSATTAAILALCDGRHSLTEIAATLADRHGADAAVVARDAAECLGRLAALGLLAFHDTQAIAATPHAASGAVEVDAGPGSLPRPLGLLAELTYRCPLHCPYCSNPTVYPPEQHALSTAEWRRVLAEAAALGVLHAHFSGGEPLVRSDLAELVAAARSAGLYTNLITSGFGLTGPRCAQLAAAGLDHVQVSLQSDDAPLADAIAGISAHARKREAAAAVRAAGLALTINVVLHQGNVDRVAAIVALAEELGAHRLELANVQFYGWAFLNKDALLPTRAALAQAERIAAAARARLRGRMQVAYVLPDYYIDRPKPCMNGWGRRHLTVNPVGEVLPCPTAGAIPSLRFDNVRDHSLEQIWAESAAFQRFRGTAWMPEPCRSCDRRDLDFGGCRCQAFLLTGDATATDPACALAPQRGVLERLLEQHQKQHRSPTEPWKPRRNPRSDSGT
jgi:pyrroloquinoline quinone biosynthesis protein E